MKLIRKLLFSREAKWRLLVALPGVVIGLVFLLSALHYSIRIKEYGKASEILNENVLIIHRKVIAGSTLKLTKTDFTTSDLEYIRENDFVVDVQPIESNNFRVWLETKDEQIPQFKTDVFLQAVPDKFLDVKSEKWRWQNGDRFVPIIMPRDFIVMLNTFLSSSGMPQLSDELVQEINFGILLSKNGKREWYNARIIGFTNEISSLLVPVNFMNYANEKFAEGQAGKTTQIMIAAKKGRFGELETFMEENGLEAKKSQVLISRLSSAVGTLFLVLMMIALVTVFTAALVLIQYLQLLMSNNDNEIRTLLRIGVSERLIISRLSGFVLSIFGLFSVLSLLLFVIVKWKIDDLFQTGGIYLNKEFSYTTFIGFSLVVVIFILASFLTARRGVKQRFR